MDSVFAANPDINELLVFEDGNCFQLKDRNLADHHKAITGQPYTLVVRGEKKEVKEEVKEVKPKTKK